MRFRNSVEVVEAKGMNRLSNLPPGVTDAMIEEFQDHSDWWGAEFVRIRASLVLTVVISVGVQWARWMATTITRKIQSVANPIIIAVFVKAVSFLRVKR